MCILALVRVRIEDIGASSLIVNRMGSFALGDMADQTKHPREVHSYLSLLHDQQLQYWVSNTCFSSFPLYTQCVARWAAKYSRSIERQLTAHAEAEKELQSQIISLHDQLEAAQVLADRKQIMVDNLSEVGNVLDCSDIAEGDPAR